MNRYFFVSFAEHGARAPAMPRFEDFREWRESKADDPIMIPLVLNWAIRMRGGIFERTRATVFETRPIGAPPESAKAIHFTTFSIRPSDAAIGYSARDTSP